MGGDGFEAIGEAVTGGAMARAVEPDAGEGGDGHTHESACLNCNTPLVGPHCHQCGQAAHVHRTIGAWWHDLAHGVLHLDGKIWRTLPMLAWRPGDLTRRYVEGERAKFVSPMAVFLFSVFMMFAIFSMVGGPVGGGATSAGKNDDPAVALAKAQESFRRQNAETQAELDRLIAERARLAAARQPTEDVDKEIAETKEDLLVETDVVEKALNMMGEEGAPASGAAAEEEPRSPGVAKRAAKEPSEGNLVVLAGADSVNSWVSQAYRKAKTNPSLLVYKLQTTAYKFSWALIPISVPFVWLLFLHRRRYRAFKAYDHTVFVTYSIAFMTLGVIALSLLHPLGLPEAIAGLAMVFVPPIHIYKQLRGAYSLSRWSALWRTFVLLNFIGIAIGLFAALLLALGLLG
ncbi:MAG TPA: DUF3667 domain-containing protein [Allosphingosinicella sp.]|jgi:hypothetical protein